MPHKTTLYLISFILFKPEIICNLRSKETKDLGKIYQVIYMI